MTNCDHIFDRLDGKNGKLSLLKYDSVVHNYIAFGREFEKELFSDKELIVVGLNVIRNYNVCARSDVGVRYVDDLKVNGSFNECRRADELQIIRFYDIRGWNVNVQVFGDGLGDGS